MTPIPKPPKRGPKPRKPIARTSRPAKVRHTVRGAEKASLNALWSTVVMATSPVCRLCLYKKATDPAHLWPKSTAPAIRHHPKNGVPLCRACHTYMDSHAGHRKLLRLALIGDVWANVLERMSLLPRDPLSREERRAMLLEELKR